MNAVSKAFELGKVYWQQADSDSFKQNKLSDKTFDAFKALEYEHLEQLEAAKQRELELLALITEARTALRDHGMYEVADLLFGEPSQALREYEAKVLEEAAKFFDGESYTTRDDHSCVMDFAENQLRRMAEERRKK